MKHLLFIVSTLFILHFSCSVALAADPRFIDKGNGTMYDTVNKLTWLKNANCFGLQTWDNAMVKANTLSSGQCELSDGSKTGDWHLPSTDEFKLLFSVCYITIEDNGDVSTIPYPCLSVPGFSSVQYNDYYWSATTTTFDATIAWMVFMADGNTNMDYKTTNSYVWPVRSAPASITVPADKKGGPSDNTSTAYDTGGAGLCRRQGLPVYSINTSFLNLVVEDTDFAWQSYGHNVNLTRVWNMSSDTTGMFGNGWSFSYESILKVVSGVVANVELGSGQILTYFPSTTEPTGTITYSYSDSSAKPILTGFISDATGAGYYTFTDKNSKLTSRYDYVSTDATTGEKIYRLTSITDRNGNILTLAYDLSARLAKMTDASNRETTFVYDANNHCTQISTFNNKTVAFEYDAAGNLIKNVDLAGNVITYVYDSNKLITSMTAADKTTGFAYFDLNGEKHVSSVTDAMGRVTEYEFLAAGGTKVTEPGGGIRTYANSVGRTTSVTDQLNQKTSTAFNDKLLPSTTTDEQRRITSYEYDADGNITKLTDPAGKITTYEYDSNWNLIKMTDPLGNIWTYGYDSKNNLTGITSPLGLNTTFTLDSKGLMTKLSRPDGSSVASTYDSHGNIISATNPLNKAAIYGFDDYGLELVSKKDPNGSTTVFSYDPNRLLTSMTLPDNKNIQYSYACNALTSSTDSGGNTTTFQRDNLLHTTKITNPLGKSSSFAYNSDGLNISITDPLGRSTSFGYDAAHRMTSITNPLGQAVLFSRNADGSVSSITNELGKTTMMSYDARGLLSAITDPLGNVITTPSYDDLGRVSSVTNARGKTVSTLYDNDGRIKEKKYDNNSFATYIWNSGNQLTSITDSTGVKTFTRDAAGQVTTINYPDGLVLSITYDDAGNVTSISYPGGPAVSYSYDSLNRTSGLTFGSNSVSMGYSAAGNLTAETRSNGVNSAYGYNAAGQLTGLSHKKGTMAIADLTYTRNGGGMITNERGTVPLTPAVTASTVTGTYNNADGMLTWNADNYTYDADGNLTAITGAKTFSAAYDNENRPVSITIGDTTTSYSYDGLGNRVKVQTTNVTRNFHHDPWGRLLFETDASGKVTANFIYAGKRLVASGTTADGYVFYHQDKTGNTLALTDSGGTVVGAFAYSANGVVLNKSGSATTPYTYAGAYGVMDEGNGLYFMKNRYYDAIAGRFIQRDPIGFAGGQSNLYAYVGGNPVDRIDPSGFGPPLPPASAGSTFMDLMRSMVWSSKPEWDVNAGKTVYRVIAQNPNLVVPQATTSLLTGSTSTAATSIAEDVLGVVFRVGRTANIVMMTPLIFGMTGDLIEAIGSYAGSQTTELAGKAMSDASKEAVEIVINTASSAGSGVLEAVKPQAKFDRCRWR